MPDTGGDVLCPTCGQWTPPAPFCTECGAALQPGVGEAGAFRRGHEVDQPGSPWDSSGERFEPEPEDQAAKIAAAAAAGAAGAARIDHLAEAEASSEPPWPPVDSTVPPIPPPEAPTEISEPDPPPAAPAPKRRTRAKAAEAAAAAAVVAAAPELAAAAPPPPPASPIIEPPPPGEPPTTYAGPPRDGDDGNSGVSGLVFVVFLGIGVLALLGGAILGGVFDGPVAEASPTPSIAASTPTPEPLPSLTPNPSPGSSGAAPTPTPAVTPPPPAGDFLARAEPCEDQPTASTCDNSGAENNGDVWILVSFRHGQSTDVVGVTVHDESGSVVDQGSIPLNFCGASTDCAGYTYFNFSNLDDGEYDVRATRNGTEVATTAFEVN